MNKQDEIIAEIRRVASKIDTSRLTRKDFARSSKISASTVCHVFGSWNRAVRAAGLEPIVKYIPEHKELSDEELMNEVIRLTSELGKPPSDREMQALGRYSPRPYTKR